MTNYLNIYESYINRMVPYNNKHRYIDFLSKFVITHGYLRGALTKISSFLARPVYVSTSNDVLKNSLKKLFDDLNITRFQMNILFNMFVFDNIAALYFPKQRLQMKCPQCGEEFDIDENYPYTFKILNTSNINKKYKAIRADWKVPFEERRLYHYPYGINCVCVKCGTKFIQEPTRAWNYEEPGIVKILNPHLTEIYKNDAGVQYLRMNPETYLGPLNVNIELEWAHIDGLPWDLICTLAGKEMVFTPSREFYEVFDMNEFASMGSGASVSSIVSTISELVHVDVLKLGNEGLALSKVNPLYVISPAEGSTEGAFDIFDHSDFRDFIVGEVKQKEEGDLNRMIFSPIQITANPVFGDGKRFLSISELSTYQQMVVTALGFNPEIISGSITPLADPFTMTSLDTLTHEFRKKTTRLLDNIAEKTIKSYNSERRKAKESGRTLFFIEKPSLAKGSFSYQQKQEAMQNGLLPKSIVYEELGYPSQKEWLEAMRNEQITELIEQSKTEQEVAKIQNNMTMYQTEMQARYGKVDTTFAKQQIQSDAEMYVQQLAQMQDYGQRKSFLAQLQNEDPVLHAVVLEKWQQYQNMQNQGIVQQQGAAPQQGGG